MQTIWKSDLFLIHKQVIRVPKYAVFLSVAMQDDCLRIWYRCNPKEDKEDCNIVITGTGELMSTFDDMRFIGTVLISNGDVLHVFEEIEK